LVVLLRDCATSDATCCSRRAQRAASAATPVVSDVSGPSTPKVGRGSKRRGCEDGSFVLRFRRTVTELGNSGLTPFFTASSGRCLARVCDFGRRMARSDGGCFGGRCLEPMLVKSVKIFEWVRWPAAFLPQSRDSFQRMSCSLLLRDMKVHNFFGPPPER